MDYRVNYGNGNGNGNNNVSVEENTQDDMMTN